MGKFFFSKVLYTREIARLKSGISLLLWLVRSLKSSNKEALWKPLLCEDYSDLTSPTSNHMPDVHLSISVVYDTLEKSFLTYPCSYSLIFHFDSGIKLSMLLL